jgi:hypothetical protein
MAATTNDRNTKWSYIERILPPIPLTAATKIPAGVMVMVVSGTGTALNGADTANGICMGVSTQLVDTTLGHTKCPVQRGAAWFGNDGTITAANIGQQATILDNQTVSLAATTTNDIIAGSIEAVDATDGVLVAFLGSKIGAT